MHALPTPLARHSAEILAIGNEVLQGDVLDTNSHWLCLSLKSLGFHVQRITVLPDNVRAITVELRRAMKREPTLIITTGGLGPTADDLTLRAVGQALRRPLLEDLQALEMVAGFYGTLYLRRKVESGELTPARRKMALLPEGSTPLPNAVGAAPGVLLLYGPDTWVTSLPGVPEEMKAIFRHSLWPALPSHLASQSSAECTINTSSHDESHMAGAIDGVASRHPEVYIKSRAQVYGGEDAVFVTLSASAAQRSECDALLAAAAADLRTELGRLGIQTDMQCA